MDWTEQGAALKAWRKSNDWTQEELAHKLGYDRTSVVNIEAGRARPRWEKAMLIANLGGPPVATWVSVPELEQASA